MQTVYEFYEECPWYYFDSSYKTLLGGCLIVFGVFGVLLNGWLCATFIYSHLLTSKSHILVLNLCTASLGRNLLGFPFASASALARRWLFSASCCQLFAFLNQFFGVFQMTAIIVLSLERFYQAKHYKNNKELQLFVYWILVGLCWLNAVALAVPPLFGFGLYSCDVTGTVCSYAWPPFSSGAKQFVFSILLILFGGLFPVITILYFVFKTMRIERRYCKSEQQKENRMLTRSLHAAFIIILIFWIPAAVLAAWQWIPLLIYGYRLHVPPALAVISPVASEAATSVPVLCYLVGDERLRASLIGRMKKHYALLRPDRAKRYNRV